MFVVDSSGSIGKRSFDKARDFVVTVIQGLTIGNHATRVGIIVFSEDVRSTIRIEGDSVGLFVRVPEYPT